MYLALCCACGPQSFYYYFTATAAIIIFHRRRKFDHQHKACPVDTFAFMIQTCKTLFLFHFEWKNTALTVFGWKTDTSFYNIIHYTKLKLYAQKSCVSSKASFFIKGPKMMFKKYTSYVNREMTYNSYYKYQQSLVLKCSQLIFIEWHSCDIATQSKFPVGA